MISNPYKLNLTDKEFFIPDQGMLARTESNSALKHFEYRSPHIDFLIWITKKYPNIDPSVTIPNSILLKFLNEYSSFVKEKHNVYINDTEKLKEEIKHIIEELSTLIPKENRVQEFVDRIFSKEKGTKKELLIKFIERYSKVEFHGFFLFLKAEERHKFIEKYWTDLNSLTKEYIDIFFSEKDTKSSSGHDFVLQFDSLKNNPNLLLPAFIIWKRNISECRIILLNNLLENQIYDVIQFVVSKIRIKADIDQICSYASGKIDEMLFKDKSRVYIEKQKANNIINVEIIKNYTNED